MWDPNFRSFEPGSCTIKRVRVCSFWWIQKLIFDPKFVRFGGQKECEIQNWICNHGNFHN